MNPAIVKQNGPKGSYYVVYPPRIKRAAKYCLSKLIAEQHATNFNNKITANDKRKDIPQT